MPPYVHCDPFLHCSQSFKKAHFPQIKSSAFILFLKGKVITWIMTRILSHSTELNLKSLKNSILFNSNYPSFLSSFQSKWENCFNLLIIIFQTNNLVYKENILFIELLLNVMHLLIGKGVPQVTYFSTKRISHYNLIHQVPYLMDKLKIPTNFCPRFFAFLNPSEYKLTSPIISLSGFDIATGLKS